MKLNPIAQASAIAMLPTMTDIERAAAEKMPIKDAMREIARNLVADLDAALQIAIDRFAGHPVTDVEEIRGRLTHVVIAGHEDEGTTYCVDGVPVLWAGPVSMERDGNMMHGERKIRQLIEGTEE
jgi:formylmethanofuran dehydrogenase subunit B